KEQVFELLRRTLRPEFLNRIDEVIMFTPLTKKDINAIVKLQFDGVVRRLQEENIRLGITDEAIQWLAATGFDPSFGARPIKRLIQKKVLNELSKELLAGKIERDSDIVMDVFDDNVVFRKPIETDKKSVMNYKL
ncbi:MAG TPA: type VI secretion system ATPase TssH, partial [Bacteroidia bacterium]|nr:type VI secretion system ATPase TssH [Bacteroidia bacterium]